MGGTSIKPQILCHPIFCASQQDAPEKNIPKYLAQYALLNRRDQHFANQKYAVTPICLTHACALGTACAHGTQMKSQGKEILSYFITQIKRSKSRRKLTKMPT